MTSNVGAGAIVEPKHLGFSKAEDETDMKQKVTEALKQTFRPEFLNRVDEVIVFNKLSDENIKQIAKILLRDVQARIAAKNITVEFSDEVAEALAKEGFDPVYGARPLKRAIVRRIEDSFSEALLSGKVCEGDTVTAVLGDGKIEYVKKTDADEQPAPDNKTDAEE